MRGFYGLAKVVAFCQLALTHALELKSPLGLAYNQGLIYLTVALCLLRGIPVLLDGQIYFKQPPEA